MKIRPVVHELFHADRRTDMTKLRVVFSQFWGTRFKKKFHYCFIGPKIDIYCKKRTKNKFAYWAQCRVVNVKIGDTYIYRVSIKSFPDYKHLLQENRERFYTYPVRAISLKTAKRDFTFKFIYFSKFWGCLVVGFSSNIRL